MKSSILAGAALLLAGCASNYAFQVRVATAKSRPVEVVAMQPSSLGPTDLEPLPGARVSCSPCDAKPTMSDIDGLAGLYFGSSYGPPPPTVVRVTAPGFHPVQFSLDEIPHDSQVGYGVFYVVLQPDPNAPPAPPPLRRQ